MRIDWRHGLLGAAAAGVALGLGSAAVAYFATHPPRRRVRRSPAEAGIEFEEIVVAARDGVRLSGWFVPSPGARAGIILCHGHANNRTEMLTRAQMLHPAGFHLLLFDFRAMGESGGDLSTIGHHEVQDLLGAVDALRARPEMEGLPVGVFGVSMGGAVALMAAAQDERIAAVAAHAAYARLDRAIAQRCRLLAGPLGPVLSRFATRCGRAWFPLDPRSVAPVDVVAAIAPRPVLLFHGARDFYIRVEDSHLLYRAAREPKTLHPLPRSWHVGIHSSDLPGYRERVVGFFQTHLSERSPCSARPS